MTLEELREDCRTHGVPIPHKPHPSRGEAIVELIEATHAQEGRLMVLRHKLERELIKLDLGGR